MRISTKIGLLVAAIFASLVAAYLALGSRLLLPTFTALERNDARLDMDRAADALDEELDQLAVVARDWGNWIEVYSFMQSRDPAFVQTNLYPAEFRSLRADVLILMDKDGRFAWSGAFHHDSSQPIDLALTRSAALPERHPWLEAARSGGSRRGLLPTEQGPLLAVQVPILDGSGAGPVRGALLLGRLLSAEEISRIGRRAHVPLVIAAAAGASVARADAQVVKLDGDTLIERSSVTEVHRTLTDIFGRPILTLRIDVPRTVSVHGVSTVRFTVASLAAAGAVVLILLLVTLDRAVVAPLRDLTRHAVRIGDDPSAGSVRLNSQRRDELGVLAREFDRMLDRWMRARRDLADRAFEAGLGEMASGALHNIGNVLTPLTVRIESLRARLREAPAEDIEATAQALRASEAGTERRTDCEALLLELGRALAGTIAESRTELESIKRQVDDLRRVISDQRRFGQRAETLEWIELAALLHECLEIIPPPLRAGLELTIEASVHGVGEVQVPRLTLRQVLENLLLNAAEAVSAGGRARGVIAVSATLQAPAEDPHSGLLQIELRDDGIGIPAENLPRLFERGFSTKSRANNSGIGLHWCATVLSMLGGGLIADSAGTGHGARMRLSLPCLSRRRPYAARAA